MGWTVGNVGWTAKNDNAKNGVLKQMEEILRRTAKILKWPRGCSSGGGCWGGQGQCSGGWGILEANQGEVEAERGCGAELGVFGPTKDVAANG